MNNLLIKKKINYIFY